MPALTLLACHLLLGLRTMKRLTKKLRVSRTTLRNLTGSAVQQAQGGLVSWPTIAISCTTTCKHSLCDSCYDTDCCLIKP